MDVLGGEMNSSCDHITSSCVSDSANATTSDVGGTFTHLPPGSNQDDGELYRATPGVVALLSVLYGSLSVAAVIGNTLVIAVVASNRGMQTVTNFFIANLSGADVVVAVFSIPFQFQAALLQRWDLPELLCPIAPFVRDVSVNVSIGALVVIAIDRYCAVMRPLEARFNRRLAQAVMAVVWVVGIAASVPSAVAFRVIHVSDDDDNDAAELTSTDRQQTKAFCYPKFPEIGGFDLGHIYRLFLVGVQYLLPLGVICYAYSRVIHRIWLNEAPGIAMDTRDQLRNRNKRKVNTATLNTWIIDRMMNCCANTSTIAFSAIFIKRNQSYTCYFLCVTNELDWIGLDKNHKK